MKQIITIALLILLPISIYSQTLQKDYLDGIEKHLSEGNCEQAERVYRAGTKNKVIEVDADIESRIAECKGSTNQSHNGHEYVDLGLSVKWATCNVGANSPEEYGDYFAWGETEPKEDYFWSTYKYCNGDEDSMTKYCTNSTWGIVDNKTTLDLKDDAAHVNWGGKWRMPTKEEQDELRDKNNCTWEWTTQNGVKGYKVTSVKNGNSIFLPAAVSRGRDYLGRADSHGYYWSSSLDAGYSSNAYNVYFNSGYVDWSSYDYRYYGQSVRAVCE